MSEDTITGAGAMRRLLKVLIPVITLATFGMCVAVSLLAMQGWRLVPVLSGSMRPALDPADLVFMRPLAVDHIKNGDIIAFKAPLPGEPLLIHRVISVHEEGSDTVVQTKGDANSRQDNFVTHFQTGNVLQGFQAVPQAGRAVHFIAAIGPRYATSFLILGFVSTMAIISIWRPNRRNPMQAGSLGSMAT